MKSYNEDRLPKLPNDDVVLEAVREAPRRPSQMGATAQQIAVRLNLTPVRRLGRGAVKGSWTGNMAPALRIGPRLRSLSLRGLVNRHWDADNYRWEYSLTDKGEDASL